jgi:hypothetical protein
LLSGLSVALAYIDETGKNARIAPTVDHDGERPRADLRMREVLTGMVRIRSGAATVLGRSRDPAESPGLLDGNPPSRRGAPGDDQAGATTAVASADFAPKSQDDKGSTMITTSPQAFACRSLFCFCRRHVDLLRVSSALCPR